MITITYVTSSSFKRDECEVLRSKGTLLSGDAVCEVFSFEFRGLSITETLEVELEMMVRREAVEAYRSLRVPCMVEHAGLVFPSYGKYPGGLTKAMWNELGAEMFVKVADTKDQTVVARSVVAYCDGMRTQIFVGETKGTLVLPRGNRKFYWDTVFVPEGESRTYAEIVDADGVAAKVLPYSQSAKALLQLFEYLRKQETPLLWERTRFSYPMT